MSPAGRAARDPSAAEKDGLEALRRLAVKGAYAVPADAALGAGGGFAVFSPRNDFAQALATISAAVFDWIRRRGWLQPEQGTDPSPIAAAGLKALHRAKSGPAAAIPAVPPKSA